MLSEKENFMRALRGEVPEYVPIYNILWAIRPTCLMGQRDRKNGGVGKDIYGIEWINEGSAFEAAIQKPGVYLLDDIRKWHDVIKPPDLASLDWEKMAAEDEYLYNPELPRGGSPSIQGFFQSLVTFMGFTECLMACFEEPEETKALVEFLCDYNLSYADKYLQYYKPEYILFGDDIAHEYSTFVSLDTFHEIFEPAWRRYIGFFKERGYLAVHHNCGHFEAFLDDLVDMGYNAWEPAQSSNDLVAIKKKYGNKLLICGGLDLSRRLNLSERTTEEEVRGTVKKLMDDLAPGGGYAFTTGTPSNDPIEARITGWVNDEFYKLRMNYYN